MAGAALNATYYRNVNKMLDSFIESNKNNRQGLVDEWLAFIRWNSYRFKEYDNISKYVFNLDNERSNKLKLFFEDDQYGDNPFRDFRYNVTNRLAIDEEGNYSYTAEIEEVDANLDKFERHIRLGCYQRDFLLQTVSEANQMAESAIKTAREIKDIKTKIYSEFIAILGIFTAISFALMGSIQTFGTVFDKVDNPSSASMGYAIEAGVVYLIIMVVLIIVLFVGMRKILEPERKFPWWAVSVVVFSIMFLAVVGLIFINK